MANLSAVARIRVIERREVHTLPAGEPIGPGIPTRQDDSAGTAMIGNATAAGEADIIGVNTSPNVNQANIAAEVLKKGLIAMYDSSNANILAGLSYGALVYLSDTDGLFADAAGTVSVVVGTVIALWEQLAAPTKVLSVDL